MNSRHSRKIKQKSLSFLSTLLILVLAGMAFFKVTAKADTTLGFNEGTGTKIHDSTGTLSGTLHNAVWKSGSECQISNCLYFSGTDSYVTFANAPALNFSAADTVTLSAWFKFTASPSANHYIMSKFDNGIGYRIFMNSAGQIVFQANSDSLTSKLSYVNSAWHQVRAVKVGTNRIELYIDDTLVVNKTTQISTQNLSNSLDLTLGSAWVGYLDEVGVVTSPTIPILSQITTAAPVSPTDPYIRQEINIIDTTIAAGGADKGIVLISANNYSGTATYYFEVVAKVTSGTGTAVLTYNAGTGSTVSGGTTVTISNITATSFTRYRSDAFTTAPTGSQNAYISSLTGTGGIFVSAARIIVLQVSDPLTSTETQVEIGNYEFNKTNTVSSPLTAPKYWTYTAANWDPAPTFTAEVTYMAAIGTTPQSNTYTTAGTTNWTVPAGVTSAVVELWGAGGAGGGGNSTTAPGGTGGGGGAYASDTVSLIPGNAYSIVVGAGGSGSTGNGTDGAASTFNTTTVVADGGHGGMASGGGAGGAGLAANSTGSTKYDGGAGYNPTGYPVSGGGGGSSAGNTSIGNAATSAAGATAVTNGGVGGSGGTSGSVGNAPVSGNGGGGGGAGTRSGGSKSGGGGAAGKAIVSYNLPASDAVTIKIQHDDGAFANWTDVTNGTIVSSGQAGTPTRLRSSTFTPADGLHYRLVSSITGSSSSYTIFNAKIIIWTAGAIQNANHLQAETFASSGTWVAPTGVTSITVEAWGAGGGSTTNSGAGGGGAYSKKNNITVIPGNTYNYTVGTSAADTNGGDSYFIDTSTVLAKGGYSGNASNGANQGKGGLASAGVGDTKYSGGDGGIATPPNIGGGGAGDSGNGSNGQGGSTNGGGSSGQSPGKLIGAGAGGSLTTQFTGARGQIRLTYTKSVPTNNPIVMGRSWGRDFSTATHNITLPPNIQAGDLLLTIIDPYTTWAITENTGLWTKINTFMYYKIAQGNDTLSFTTQNQLTYVTLRIKNGGIPIVSNSTGGLTGSADPPLLDLGATVKALWLAVDFFKVDTLNKLFSDGISAPPNNYTLTIMEPNYDWADNSIGLAEQLLNVSSENPGPFTNSSHDWSAYTIAIPFSGAATYAAINKFESQYLLSNSPIGTTTGLKGYDTHWDSGEWYGVTNQYYHESNGNSTAYLQSQVLSSSGSWTAPSGVYSVSVEAWGAGGGGSVNLGGGGGGAYSKTNYIPVIPGNSYNYTIGISAVNTNGSDSYWGDGSLLMAKGGLSGANGSTGGQAAAGIGDIKYSGGNGQTGTGGKNGGGGAGDQGDGVANIGGQSNGGNGGTYTGGMFAAGGGSQVNSIANPGSPGQMKITYNFSTDGSFPRIISRSWGKTSNSTSHSLTMPTEIQPGNLLLIIISVGSTTSTIIANNWTTLAQQASYNNTLAMFYKTAVSNDTVTISTSVSTATSYIILNIANGGMPSAAVAYDLSGLTYPDPPLLSPAGGIAKYLWLATVITDFNNINNYPANFIYSLYQPTIGMNLNLSERLLETSSQDPASYGILNDRWVASTIAIPPNNSPTATGAIKLQSDPHGTPAEIGNSAITAVNEVKRSTALTMPGSVTDIDTNVTATGTLNSDRVIALVTVGSSGSPTSTPTPSPTTAPTPTTATTPSVTPALIQIRAKSGVRVNSGVRIK